MPAFVNGPVLPPNIEVEQIYRLRNPLVANSGLPVVVIGINRQVEFQNDLGMYDGTAVSLDIPSLDLYSATPIELAAQSYIDDDGVAQLTPSLPDVIFRHPVFGDVTIPKKDVGAGVLGWTLDAVDGELDLDASIPVTYTIQTGTGDLSELLVSTALAVNADAGLRTFIDLEADFIGAFVAAGDDVVLSDGSRFNIVTVVNETTLIVQDLVEGLVLPTTAIDDANYTIEKTFTTGGGTILLTYVANRSDRANEIITIDREVADQELGVNTYLNPLRYYVGRALDNTTTTVLAVQLSSDTTQGWTTALETLSKSDVPYDLVPLTQDEDILTQIIAHVDLMSTPAKAKERRVFTNYPLVIRETKATSGAGFQPFGTLVTNSNRTAAASAIVRVPAGQNNLHVLGVQQGDVFRDLTPGFEGSARITVVTPASAAPDADVTLTLATPNTWKLFGTQATLIINPFAAQQFAVDCDVAATVAGDVVHINVDGITTIFTAVAVPATPVEFLAASNNSLLTVLQAFYGDRLIITQPGGAGTPVRIRDIYGALPTARLVGLRSSATVVWTLVSGGAFVVNLPAGPDTPMPDDDVTDGVDDGDIFSLNDYNNLTQIYEFNGDQTTANGSIVGGNVQVQIGGLSMTATDVRDRIIAAINAAANPHSLTLTGAAGAVVPAVLVTSSIAGTSAGAFSVTGIPVGVPTAPVTFGASVLGTGAVGPASPITSWQVTTQDLTPDQQATAAAQRARDLANHRVINTWPDICDEQFSDNTAGEDGPDLGEGIYGGNSEVTLISVPDYSIAVAAAATRANRLSSDPLTKRPMVGPHRLRRVDDTYTQTQLDRILSTGNMVFEQPSGAGSSVQPIRGVTTDTTDLKLLEENVGAAVDKFTRLVRINVKPIFGPNVIDPEGQFLELFQSKVQAVINVMTRRESREAVNITIVRVYENPDQKDSVIMEVEFEPLFGANFGLVKIYI